MKRLIMWKSLGSVFSYATPFTHPCWTSCQLTLCMLFPPPAQPSTSFLSGSIPLLLWDWVQALPPPGSCPVLLSHPGVVRCPYAPELPVLSPASALLALGKILLPASPPPSLVRVFPLSFPVFSIVLGIFIDLL